MTFSGFLHATTYALFVSVALVLLRNYVYGFSERTLRDVFPFVRRIILEDLQNLLHPEIEDHIRTTVSHRQFKTLQWKRIHLTLQYLGDLAKNAKVFQAWAKYERSLSLKFPDPERKRASLDLITACVQSRMCVFQMQMRLHWWLIRMAFLPFLAPPSFKTLQHLGSFDVLVFYGRVKEAAGELSIAYGEKFYQELLQVI
jgi:hypothetical protein